MRLAELELPATPEFVSLARLVVSSIADDRYELTDDQLHNLKLAVSEACVLAIEANLGPSEGALDIRCNGSGDRLEVSIGGRVRLTSDPTAQVDLADPDRVNLREVGLPLIGSLVDDVSVEPSSAGNCVRMTLRCPRAEEF